MGSASWELLFILLFMLFNGFFAAAEIAILTARRGRLEQQAEAGDSASTVALRLAKDTDRFLPTVQVGITVGGVVAAAFSGDRFAQPLAAWLGKMEWPLLQDNAKWLAMAMIVHLVAFGQLIIGELVPKRVALQNAETLARLVAYPMLILQTISRPAIWVLQSTTNLILLLLGQRAGKQSTVSVEDIQHLIDAGAETGLLEESEQKVAMEALRLGERTVVDVLRPRVEIDAIDIDTPADEVVGAVAMSGYSRIPVCEKNIDHIIGFVYIKDLFMQQYLERPIDLRRLVRPALFVPKSITISRLMELFQEQRTQLAIVLDEYGGTEGMVTVEDVLEMLVGEIHDEHRQDRQQLIVPRSEGGGWLVDAAANLHELQDAIAIPRFSEPAPRGVGTVSGLVLALLKRPPRVADVVHWGDLRLEVVDMDGPRIDRVLVQNTDPAAEPSSSTSDSK